MRINQGESSKDFVIELSLDELVLLNHGVTGLGRQFRGMRDMKENDPDMFDHVLEESGGEEKDLIDEETEYQAFKMNLLFGEAIHDSDNCDRPENECHFEESKEKFVKAYGMFISMDPDPNQPRYERRE